jgi:hypothetical protein
LVESLPRYGSEAEQGLIDETVKLPSAANE